MEELFALQQQLAEIQETSTKYRLSDRIIIDLIEKLVKEYDLKVYHSTDGQSLVTPNQLSKEIHQLILSNKRVAVNQLPDILGIGFDKIEGQIEKDSNGWDVVRMQDEMMSHDYILNVCEEINEDLQQKSIISLQEIMQKYALPMQFVQKYVLQQVGTIIQGVLNEDKLTTVTYLEIITAKLCGILRATLSPISFIKLNKDLEIQNSQKICEQLLITKQLDGKIISGQYVSSRFIQSQEAQVKSFFEQNSYVEYDKLYQQFFIQKPKEYLKQMFKDNVIFLDTCGFSRDALLSKQDQIQELLINEGHTNLQEILPVILSDQDIETLFSLMQLNNCEYSNFMIYNKAFLDKLALAFKDKIIESIYQNPQKLIEQQQNQDDTVQDIQASAGGFANKKNKKQQQPQKKKQQNKQELFTNKEITDLLTQKKLVEYNDCVDELFQFLQPRLSTLYEQIKIELFESKKSASSQVIQEIQKKIEDMALGLMITQRSLQKIQQECHEVNTKVLVDNCLFGYRLLVENLVVITCKKYNIQLPQNLFADPNHPSVVNGQINFGLQKSGRVFLNKVALGEAILFLPKEQQKALKDTMELYTKKSLDILSQHTFFDVFNLKVQLDKKNDRNLLLFIKHHCKEYIKQRQNEIFDENVFNQIILAMSTDLGLYFVGNYDQQFYSALKQIVYELQSDKQIKTILNNIIHSINQQLEITAEAKELLELLKLL
ncbi:unnamed protein product [Paramecium pentaurelia]|uniref:E3 UFM1-protein ligase 1-like N-terminal domain-containing protein n=1 Tax=Paramecium pentaurelia TaxID=43138 RepID=A0A8S1V2E7_9CILI|nr:unnamed protein product [Paramecium pentaurelia]